MFPVLTENRRFFGLCLIFKNSIEALIFGSHSIVRICGINIKMFLVLREQPKFQKKQILKTVFSFWLRLDSASKLYVSVQEQFLNCVRFFQKVNIKMFPV